jgi:flavin-dependent dehydrogenase
VIDALIAGAGPAGAMAAIVLARAGARVVLVDRDEFPRDKLCGDTLNPGAVRLLTEYGLAGLERAGARHLGGMHVTGPRASVHARYAAGMRALAITRRALDGWLVEQAIAAGARFEGGVTVRGPLVDDVAGVPVVRGLALDRRGHTGTLRMPGVMTIAADGRRSTIARAVGLAGRPSAPRRWAYGTYAERVAGLADEGEMHIRHGWYFGIAPVETDLANICLVRKTPAAKRRPIDVVRDAIAADPLLRARFGEARIDERVRVLGPLSAEASSPGMPGLLLAGDAAGFVDPMTGDGVHLALTGAVLAAKATLHALETGDVYGAAPRLARARRTALGAKTRFNRLVRGLVDSPRAIDVANAVVRIWPGALRGAIRYAGDVR